MTTNLDGSYLLILQEVNLHPHSYLSKLEGAFEAPSIVRIHSKDGLRKYRTPPVYDERYLVLFDSVKILEANIGYVNLDIMFPVITVETKGKADEARYLCQDKHVPCRVFQHKFLQADGVDLVHELATEEVSDSFCKALVSRVGKSPKRILSAIMVCEQVGYKTSNITKYVDKYVYIDMYDVIESLLHRCKSHAQQKRAAVYVHQNRFWYNKFTRPSLVKELELLLKMYGDITDGVLTEYTVHEYSEAERIPRFRVLYACNLYESVSYVTLLSLKQFLEKASILEVTMRLS